MRVKCDKCSANCSADVEKLMDLGWSRVTMSNPIKKTFTRCPKHKAGLTEEVGKAQGWRVGG